ncbi:MAG: hypothetical protein HOO91_06435 [Bacteroidales bacterium]|nr:hypothetical protein [Bacteroidales bacterium]
MIGWIKAINSMLANKLKQKIYLFFKEYFLSISVTNNQPSLISLPITLAIIDRPILVFLTTE